LVISFDGYPLIGPLISSLIARRFRAKSISVIYDLYPDIAMEQGIIKRRQFVSLARKLENLSYDWSDHIVVLSEGFRRTLINDRGVKSEKISVIPVWLDARSILPMDRDNPWRREMKIPKQYFVILYAGTIGIVPGAEIITEVAQHLAPYPDILFLMVGDGYAKDEVQSKARSLGLSNIWFFPFQPRDRLSELQATADISLVTLAPGRGRTSVPSKVLGYMAAGRPIVAAVDQDCDTADMIKKAECGLVVPAGDRKSLSHAILYYYNHSKERVNAGKSGRAYFLQNYEKQTVTRKYLDLIKNLLRT